MAIRSACAGDAARLTEVAHAAKRHWGYPEELIERWRADLTVTEDFIAEHPIGVAVDGADVVGFYALSNEGETFELEHLWVEPLRMRAGIGAELFAHALETVRSRGGSKLEIASDPNAEGFYRRMGARRLGTIPSQPEGRTLPLLVCWLEPLADVPEQT